MTCKPRPARTSSDIINGSWANSILRCDNTWGASVGVYRESLPFGKLCRTTSFTPVARSVNYFIGFVFSVCCPSHMIPRHTKGVVANPWSVCGFLSGWFVPCFQNERQTMGADLSAFKPKKSISIAVSAVWPENTGSCVRQKQRGTKELQGIASHYTNSSRVAVSPKSYTMRVAQAFSSTFRVVGVAVAVVNRTFYKLVSHLETPISRLWLESRAHSNALGFCNFKVRW